MQALLPYFEGIFEGMKEAMTLLINEAMRVERQSHLGAAPFERSEQRQGYASWLAGDSLEYE